MMCEHEFVKSHFYDSNYRKCRKCGIVVPKEMAKLQKQLVSAKDENKKLRREIAEFRRGEGRAE